MTLDTPLDSTPNSDPLGPQNLVFEKYHGAANDFLFLELQTPWQEQRLSFSKAARQLCDRRRALGADGLVVWKFAAADESSKGQNLSDAQGSPRLTVGIWNSDGSFAATCGNALRCLGLALRRRGVWSGQTPLDVWYPPFPFQSHPEPQPSASAFATLISELPGNARHLPAVNERRAEANLSATIEVSMGTCHFVGPLFSQDHRLLQRAFQDAFERTAPALGLEPPVTIEIPHIRFVQLANPHVVVFLEPKGTNGSEGLSETVISEFLRHEGEAIKALISGFQDPRSTGDSGIQLHEVNLGVACERRGSAESPHLLVVHERGAGITPACGSGCTAAYIASQDVQNENGNAKVCIEGILDSEKPQSDGERDSDRDGERGRRVHYRMPGGDLSVRTVDEGGYILGGPAAYVGRIEVPLASL